MALGFHYVTLSRQPPLARPTKVSLSALEVSRISCDLFW